MKHKVFYLTNVVSPCISFVLQIINLVPRSLSVRECRNGGDLGKRLANNAILSGGYLLPHYISVSIDLGELAMLEVITAKRS